MGYLRKKHVRLVFADPEFEGLECLVRPPSINQLIEYDRITTTGNAGPDEDPAQHTSRVWQLTNDAIDLLAAALVSWNVENPGPDDEPVAVPATQAGIATQEPRFVFDVLRAWIANTAGVSRPLAPTSTGGQPSLEESIPMDVPS